MELTDRSTETRLYGDVQVRRACESARKLERAGDYEGARLELRKFWTKIGVRPVVDHLPSPTKAEALLRVGSLSGWLGSEKQIPGAQEFARDLLSESVRLFESLGERDKHAEAMTDLALCYWRSGMQDNGRVYFQQALETAQAAETKLRALNSASTVEISSGRFDDALALLDKATTFLEEVTDEASHGRYHSQRGSVYISLGGRENLDRGLVEYGAASMHFANAGHVRYLARVENNIGYTLLELGRTREALPHLNKAGRIFVSLKDPGSVAQVNETRARVFLAEKRFPEAERAILSAVLVIEEGDDHSLLAEALTTQGSVFAGSGKYESARKAFNRASEVAAAADDSHLAAVAQLRMIEEMGSVLSRDELLVAYRNADQYVGEGASQSDLQRLRVCGRAVVDNVDDVRRIEEELIGGTLEEEVNHFKARVARNELEQEKGSVPRAAKRLGLTRQGLAKILAGRQSKTLEGARRPKRFVS